ncbi:MAG: ferritin family protein [Deltaproteobacteria bacterium]|nr:ferritin family protein [Deltaproteobacteria bacterium]
MDEIRKSLLEALTKAIDSEYEGYGFYLMASKATEDALGREVFGRLAQEEQAHAAFLKAQHRSIAQTGNVDSRATLGNPYAVAGGSPIFSPELRGRIGDAHFEMSALGVGIHLEQNAMEFYAREALTAPDAAVRAFFRELAEWEAGHYRALLAQQEELQEDYRTRNGFEPF